MTFTGLAIQGCAVQYNTTLNLTGGYKVVLAGALDLSLRSSAIVGMWLQHKPSLVIGNTRSNLILESNDFGLFFRCHLRDDEISNHAHALVSSKAMTEVSVGLSYDPDDSEVRKIGRHDVVIIKKATLRECSIVESGACLATSATIIDVAKSAPLFQTTSLVSDNAAEDFLRKLRRLQ